MSKAAAREGPSASDRITRKIGELGDWRGKLRTHARADPARGPEGRRGVEVDGHAGLVPRHGSMCTGESHKQVVKLTFAKGAPLKRSA
jgi:hypothetical protein